MFSALALSQACCLCCRTQPAKLQARLPRATSGTAACWAPLGDAVLVRSWLHRMLAANSSFPEWGFGRWRPTHIAAIVSGRETRSADSSARASKSLVRSHSEGVQQEAGVRPHHAPGPARAAVPWRERERPNRRVPRRRGATRRGCPRHRPCDQPHGVAYGKRWCARARQVVLVPSSPSWNGERWRGA